MTYRLLQGVAAVVLLVGAVGAGCDASWFNNTQPLTDPVSIAIVNRTPYRAILTGGAWEPLDRESLPQFGNVRIESKENDTQNLGIVSMMTNSCRRAISIGSQELISQINRKDEQLAAGGTPIEDPAAMIVGVNFSDAPADSPDAANPTVGRADPLTVLHGVDYPCGSLVVFQLIEDAEAAGGFRVEFGVIY